MKKYLTKILLICLFNGIQQIKLIGQENNKVWFDGFSRSLFTRDAVTDNAFQDTVSARNTSNGYNLLDLNTHVNPSENIEIFSQIRIKNQFGGFFGSGTSIDVRQLRAKGVINNKIRFSVGDLFLKQTRFTLFNYNEDLSGYESNMFKPYRDIIQYENFYRENRWRSQGLQTDFSFQFDRYIRTLEFDAFITRPRGSSAITSNTYSNDLLLSGGTVVSQLNENLKLESHYINIFEVPNSGTTNISIRNPVYHIGISNSKKNKKSFLNQKFQTGFSEKYWLHSERENNASDSISNLTQGMFLELNNEFLKKDSSWQITLGYRYVDPNFRSVGAQTRRLDFDKENFPNIYPYYTNSQINRPISIFDLLADENIYNEELQENLMLFNPVYSNVLPYGDATPNRHGFYLKSEVNYKVINGRLNTGFFQEVIGQGTVDKRNFAMLKTAISIRTRKLLKLKKEASISLASENEFTNRNKDTLSQIELYSHQLTVFGNLEILEKLFLQVSLKQFNAKGNEFLTQRNNYGVINNFILNDFDFEDYLVSGGILYNIKKNVYVNLQYNWWGKTFNNNENSNFNYNRLLFILSVKL